MVRSILLATRLAVLTSSVIAAAVVLPPILTSRADKGTPPTRRVCDTAPCAAGTDDGSFPSLGRPELPASAIARSGSIEELLGRKSPRAGRLYPMPELEPVEVYLNRSGDLVLSQIPVFNTSYGGKYASVSKAQQVAFYSLNPELQRLAADLVRRADSPHVAIVAMEPSTGRILALAQKSTSIPNLITHTGFPAASLFKVVTSAATLENTKLEPNSIIRYRGGTYVLERWNYMPDARRDRHLMTLKEALGKSCNAVFGRIAFSHLNTDLLKKYSRSFGFNQPIKFERPLPVSPADIPTESYELSRTAAGFGEVRISPIHAAAIMSGVANDGMMPRPILVDKVLSASGSVLYESKPEMIRRMVQESTAHVLLDMMESTTTQGTSRKEFMIKNRPVLGGIEVAAKTGTLKGDNPSGTNHWFIAAAPKQNPKIALAIISVDPRSSKGRPSRLGRMLIDKYLRH